YAYHKFWQPALPAAGTVVETYFRNRGITTAIPPTIRYLPEVFHPEYGWSFPAMVGAIQRFDGKFSAATVTWLCADGSGKAPVYPPRKIYGPYRGSLPSVSPQPAAVLPPAKASKLSCLFISPVLNWQPGRR